MRSDTMTRVENLFKQIERAKKNRMDKLLSNARFVAKHFPYQEFAARKTVVRLGRLQDSLMMLATA